MNFLTNTENFARWVLEFRWREMVIKAIFSLEGFIALVTRVPGVKSEMGR
jgi:hypothetical protein